MSLIQIDAAEFERVTRLAWIISELQRIRVTARERGEHYSSNQLGLLTTGLAGDVRAAADAAMSETAPSKPDWPWCRHGAFLSTGCVDCGGIA